MTISEIRLRRRKTPSAAPLSAGTTILDTAVDNGQEAIPPSPSMAGEDAFKLHDTYGFPIDLTLEMAAEQGVTVDEARASANSDGRAEGPRPRRRSLKKTGTYADRPRLRRLQEGAGSAGSTFLGYTEHVRRAPPLIGIMLDGKVFRARR